MQKNRIRLTGVIALLMLALALQGAAVSAQVPEAVLWTAQFYNSISFTPGTEAATTTYPTGLNYTWTGVPTDANGIPLSGVNADNFSVQFAATATFPETGDYTFTVTIDDQATVRIDGIDVLIENVPGTYTFVRNLSAGQHTLQVRLVELTQSAIISITWSLGAVAPVEPSGPIGNVVQVRGLSLRTGPYLGASFIGVLRPDIAYPVLARNNDEGGPYTWYKVQAGERVGWSSGRYLNIQGNVDDIPFETTIFEQIGNPPDVQAIAVPRAIMNLRRRPSVRSFRLDQVPWGEPVELLGRTLQGGQNHWLQVRYEGQVGWIFAPFVTVRGNVAAVPIY